MSALSVPVPTVRTVYRGVYQIGSPTVKTYPRFTVRLPEGNWMISQSARSPYTKIEFLPPLETTDLCNKKVVMLVKPNDDGIEKFYTDLRSSLSLKCKFKEAIRIILSQKILFVWKLLAGGHTTGIVTSSPHYIFLLLFINGYPNSLECANRYIEILKDLQINYFPIQCQ